MRKTKTLLASIFLCLALTATMAAQGGAVKDIPATSTIADLSFRIQSDGQGSYIHLPSVRSVVQTHGDWILDLGGSKRFQPTRFVRIYFDDPVVEGTPGPLGAVMVNANARFIASCHRAGYDVNMLDMLPGSEATCPLNIAFDQPDGRRYGIVMNNASLDTFGGQEDTDSVTIKCLNANNQCNSWPIRPYQNGPSSRGRLFKFASKPNQPNQDLGDFNFSFDITISIP